MIVVRKDFLVVCITSSFLFAILSLNLIMVQTKGTILLIHHKELEKLKKHLSMKSCCY